MTSSQVPDGPCLHQLPKLDGGLGGWGWGLCIIHGLQGLTEFGSMGMQPVLPKQGNIKTAFIIEIEFYSEILEIWQTTKDRAK